MCDTFKFSTSLINITIVYTAVGGNGEVKWTGST